jgi:hypothetical protein
VVCPVGCPVLSPCIWLCVRASQHLFIGSFDRCVCLSVCLLLGLSVDPSVCMSWCVSVVLDVSVVLLVCEFCSFACEVLVWGREAPACEALSQADC